MAKRKSASLAVPLSTAPMEVEVRYDHVTGDRFRHGAKLVRWRPDKSPRQCTFEQLQAPARPSRLIGKVLHQGA